MAVLNLLARPDVVRVELTALGPHRTGPFKLVVQHAMGTIIEYFGDVTHARIRQGALEELLMKAGTAGSSEMTVTRNHTHIKAPPSAPGLAWHAFRHGAAAGD
jgi:hypothetical protein